MFNLQLKSYFSFIFSQNTSKIRLLSIKHSIDLRSPPFHFATFETVVLRNSCKNGAVYWIKQVFPYSFRFKWRASTIHSCRTQQYTFQTIHKYWVLENNILTKCLVPLKVLAKVLKSVVSSSPFYGTRNTDLSFLFSIKILLQRAIYKARNMKRLKII